MSTCNNCETCDNPENQQRQAATASAQPAQSVVSLEDAREKLREATRNAHLRVKGLMAQIEAAKTVMLAGVERTGVNSARVNFSRVGAHDWSPERFMPERQVEAIVIAMRSAANGAQTPLQSLEELLVFAKAPVQADKNTIRLKQVGSVSIEVAQAVEPALREWVGLLEQTRALVQVVAPSSGEAEGASPTLPPVRKRCAP